MPWTDQLKGDPISWLMEPDSPGVRYLAMRDLLDLPPGSPELLAARREAHVNGPLARALGGMKPEGYWSKPGPGYSPKYRGSVWAMILLAEMGGDIREDPRVATACTYMLEHNLNKGGQFTCSQSGAPSGTIDCLQGNLCWSLRELGCEDPRLEKAFEWMARTVTGEGVAPKEEKDAPVRYYAYKSAPNFVCGPNDNLPCAWGASKVMLAFSRLPPGMRTPVIDRAIRQGVEFLFSVDPADAAYPCPRGQKPNRGWWKFGFPCFYHSDILQLADALVALGYGTDPRLARTLAFIRDKQDDQGRWLLEEKYENTWVNVGEKHHPNKWVTLRALRVLKAVG